MSKHFIIIEPDPVVRMDIEGILIDAYPRCHVTAGATLLDVGAAIYDCGPDSALFVRGTMVSANDDLGRVVQVVATRGCHVVIIGDASDFDFPATVIELPFTTDIVIAAVLQEGRESSIKAAG